VKPGEHLGLLQGVYRDKQALYRRHQAGAAGMPAYDGNNVYQYILAREDAHLQWLSSAIGDGSAAPSDSGPGIDLPATGKGDDRIRAIAQDDARTAREFLARWQPRAAALTHARDRRMIELILGETAEHQRLFEQVASGRDDVLGRRPEGAGTGGGVLPVRWIE
jgi:hypothetical protein